VPKNITVGNHTVLNKNVLLDDRGGHFKIGNNVYIGQVTNIWMIEHDVHVDHHIDIDARIQLP
jgi:UDP-3-O-[3-hydroxymyristoyl] glucosamine N-acyltransferase